MYEPALRGEEALKIDLKKPTAPDCRVLLRFWYFNWIGQVSGQVYKNSQIYLNTGSRTSIMFKIKIGFLEKERRKANFSNNFSARGRFNRISL